MKSINIRYKTYHKIQDQIIKDIESTKLASLNIDISKEMKPYREIQRHNQQSRVAA